MHTKDFRGGAALRNLLAYLGAAFSLAACHGGTGSQSQLTTPQPSPPPSTPSGWQGHVAGVMDTGAGIYDVEGLLTADGLLRLGLSNSDPTDPAGTLQFVGHVEVMGTSAHGSGIVIGEGCSVSPQNPFCAASAEAAIGISGNGNPESGVFEAHGEIDVSTSAGQQRWLAVLGYSGNIVHGATYSKAADLKSVEGEYTAGLADLQRDGDTVVSVDGAGRLFFQSPSSGCVGNGVLAAHLDGSSDVYDVTLTVESCEFEGLATHETRDPAHSSSGDRLIMWLSTPAGATPPAALTMWIKPTNDGCPGCWDY